jgi:hypothetical protein
MLAQAQGIHVDVAAERLLGAASRAGITEAQAARAVMRVLSED